MGRKPTRREIELSDEDRERLEQIIGNPRSPQKHVWRARIILELGSGRGLVETMRRTGMPEPTVRRWWDRFLAGGVDGPFRDATRPPGKKPVPEEKVKAVIALAMSPPPEHARHWTVRALARKSGMVISTVHGILKANGLRPRQVKTFKVSRDPRFGIKVRDVAGLCVDPPDRAAVLSVDGKTQIQALGRTQRPLPMKPGHAGTGPTTAGGTAPPACWPRSTSPPARSSAGRPGGTARRSSSPSPITSRRGSIPEPRSMPSSTASPRTSRPRSANG